MFELNDQDYIAISKHDIIKRAHDLALGKIIQEWMPFIKILHEYVNIKKKTPPSYHKMPPEHRDGELCSNDEHIIYLSDNFMITDAYYGNIHLWVSSKKKKWQKIGILKCFIGQFCHEPKLYSVNCPAGNSYYYQKLFTELKQRYIAYLNQKSQILQHQTMDLNRVSIAQ
jgi:hypothetical protein